MAETVAKVAGREQLACHGGDQPVEPGIGWVVDARQFAVGGREHPGLVAERHACQDAVHLTAAVPQLTVPALILAATAWTAAFAAFTAV